MSEEAQAPTAPAEGPLSVDQAVSLLGSRAAPAEAAPEEPTESEAPPEAEDQALEPIEANEGEEPAEPPEPATPAIEPPKFWDADAKERFRELSPEHQAVVLAQVDKSVQSSAKAIQEAATRAKEAEQNAKGITALAAELGEFLPKAIKTFQGRWEGVDWVQLARDDPGQYVAYKAEHDAEQGELERINTANQRAQAEARAAFVRAEAAALATHAPELVDPKEGTTRQKELASYLKDKGVSDEDLSGLTAVAAGLAYKAMLYDRAKAVSVVPLPKPKPVAAKVTPPTSSAANPQHRSVMDASARLNKTGTTEDAIRLLQARRKG